MEVCWGYLNVGAVSCRKSAMGAPILSTLGAASPSRVVGIWFRLSDTQPGAPNAGCQLTPRVDHEEGNYIVDARRGSTRLEAVALGEEFL